MDAKRTFNINIADQVNDQLFTSNDMLDYFQNIIKVRNSKIIAARELEFSDNTTSVAITCNKDDIIKKNLKLYIKRYLRFKSLADFIKVHGDSKDGFTLEYINKVDDAE
ncbi:large subunit ribosomal protein L22e [Enteropsectra breve]|nr:large subunit ribosomal protein L22e [Enteropsectra breve]